MQNVAPPAPLVASTSTEVDEAVRSEIVSKPSPQTHRVYWHDWNQYTAWLAAQGLAVTQVRPRHVQLYVAKLGEDKRAKSSIGRALSVIRTLYGSIVREELMPTNPAREAKAPKTDTAPKAPYIRELDDVLKLITVPASSWKERRDRFVVALLVGLGWRRAEVARLKVSDFGSGFDDDGRPIVTVTGIFKGSKVVTVGLPDWLALEGLAWCAYAGIRDSVIFPRSPDDQRPIQGNIVYRIVRRMCRRAGIKKISPHSIRRTTITWLRELGVDIKRLQLMVGHSQESTTGRYDKKRDASIYQPGEKFGELRDRKPPKRADAEHSHALRCDTA